MTRADLHKLVDEISENRIDRVAALIAAINANDRAGIVSALAEEVMLDPHEIALLEEFDRDPDREKRIPAADVRKHLGI